MKTEIYVENFGPIGNARVKLDRFSVFMGQNSSGKSYLTRLIKIIIDSVNGVDMEKGYSYKTPPPMFKTLFKNVAKYDEEIKIHKRSSDFIMKTLLMKRLTENISSRMERFFPSLKQNIDKASFFEYYSDNLTFRCTVKKRMVIEIELIKTPNFPEVYLKNVDDSSSEYILTKNQRSISIQLRKQNTDVYHRYCLSLNGFLISLNESCKSNYADVLYIPGGRSGLYSMFKYTIDNAIFSLNDAESDIPSYAKEFYACMYRFGKSSDGEYQNLANKYAEKIFKNSMKISKDRFGRKYYSVVQNGRELSIGEASSSMHEIGPILTYIGFGLKKNDLIIIEEPEAHLHPTNQEYIAELIINLVNDGVNVLITTHSPILLAKINLMILSGDLTEHEMESLLIEKRNTISKEFVSAYLFEKTNEDSFNLVTNVDDEWISEEGFISFFDKSYETESRIRNMLEGAQKNNV